MLHPAIEYSSPALRNVKHVRTNTPHTRRFEYCCNGYLARLTCESAQWEDCAPPAQRKRDALPQRLAHAADSKQQPPPRVGP
jgi:hypothetical protein